MNVLTDTRRTPLAATGSDIAGWRQRFARLAAWWQAWRDRQALRRLDAYWCERRSARERYLSQARDVFELERYERQWERHADYWRM